MPGSLIKSVFDNASRGMIIEVSDVENDTWQTCLVLWAQAVNEDKYVDLMIGSLTKMRFKLPAIPSLKLPTFSLPEVKWTCVPGKFNFITPMTVMTKLKTEDDK
jgi:hypothetical protein